MKCMPTSKNKNKKLRKENINKNRMNLNRIAKNIHNKTGQWAKSIWTYITYNTTLSRIETHLGKAPVSNAYSDYT